MADKLMYLIIPNDDSQNYPFYRLKLVVETFEHSIWLINQSKFTKFPKVVNSTRRLYQTLGTSVNLELKSMTYGRLRRGCRALTTILVRLNAKIKPFIKGMYRLYIYVHMYCSTQGYKGIRQLPIDWCTSSMVTTSVDYN